MAENTARILEILDACCDAFTFPMLDNGYVYLAATRLSLYRSTADWAMVIEVFGFSPRSGMPSTHIHTFASRLHNRDSADRYASQAAHQQYLSNNPHNESRFVHPIEEGDWQDPDEPEILTSDASEVSVRGRSVPLIEPGQYADHNIELEDPPNVCVHEMCRFLAATVRDSILCTEEERRVSVPPELEQILQLEEWHHPDVVDDEERPSGSETFQQLATVLSTGSKEDYRPSQAANTDWTNWPEGGQL